MVLPAAAPDGFGASLSPCNALLLRMVSAAAPPSSAAAPARVIMLHGGRAARAAPAQATPFGRWLDHNFAKLAVIGLATGVCASFVGGGAEILIIPMLVGFGVFASYKQAIGTSLASLLLPIGAFAVYFYSRQPCRGVDGAVASCIDWPYAIIISAFFTLGTAASYFSVGMNTTVLKLVFACVIIVMGIYILTQHALTTKIPASAPA